MTTQHFDQVFAFWSLGLGFTFLVIVVIATAGYFSSNSHHRRQEHRHQMAILRQKQAGERLALDQRAIMVKNGIDPEYVAWLREQLREN